MRIDFTKKIDEFSVTEVQRGLRRALDLRRTGAAIDEPALMQVVSLHPGRANRLLAVLLSEGLLARTDAGLSITVLGKNLALARRTRISRAAADRIIAITVSRCRRINRSPDYLYTVANLWVVGSYARGEPDLGDVDLKWKLIPRWETTEELLRRTAERVLHAKREGLYEFLSVREESAWHFGELLRFVKRRQPRLEIGWIKGPEDLIPPVAIPIELEMR